MKKTLFIIATLITLLLTGCNKEYKPLYEYADKMGVELDAFSIVKKRDYCDIDSIRYYDNLLLKKSNELAGKVKANPYISNDSISKYRKYGLINFQEGKPNCTAYYGVIKGTNKLVGVYVMDDGRTVSFDTEKAEYISMKYSQWNYLEFVDGLIY